MSATTVITAADPVSLDGGRPTMPAATHGTALRMSMVTRDYFRMLGIPVLRGRVITAEDERALAPVAAINAPAAERWFGTRDRVVQRIRIDSFGTAAASWLTIVGVDGGIRNDPLFHRVPPSAIYTAALLWVPESFDAVLASVAAPALLTPLVARAMSSLTPDARRDRDLRCWHAARAQPL